VRRGTALLAATSLFLLGVLVGVLATHAFYLARIREPGGMFGLGMRLIATQLHWRLDLTDEQERQLDAILGDTQREAMALRAEFAPRALAVIDRSRERVLAILTPEQQDAFLRASAQQRRRAEELLIGPRMPPPPLPTSHPTESPPANTEAPPGEAPEEEPTKAP